MADKYLVEIDGQKYQLEGDHPPTEAEARAAVAGHQPAALGRTWTDTAVDALPTVGGAIGGLVGLAGGRAGSIGGAALGGAGGEGWRQTIQALRGKGALLTPSEAMQGMGERAATQAGATVGGEVLGAGAKLLGRGLYRAGALPLMQSWKYGDLVKTGIENRVPVTKAGLEKAGQLLTTRQADKTAALGRVVADIPTADVTAEAMTKAAPLAQAAEKAGFGNPYEAFANRAKRIVEAQPVHSPTSLDAVKGTIDDTLGPAYKKLRMKEALAPAERINLELSHAMGRAVTNAVPEYPALNKGIMDAMGLKKMLARRMGPGGANQGLENAMTAAIGAAAIPGRLLMLPGVASTAGIGAHMIGEHPVALGNLSRAALLALMAGEPMPSHEPER